MSSPGPASPLVLSLRGVSKAFGAVQALRDVSVDCRAGEIHALVGENGSGKSTLLGIASGFVASGRGSRRDRRAAAAGAALPPRRGGSGLGIAYQTYSHVLDLSVAENLYLAVPADVRPKYGRMEEWAAARLDGVRARRPADGGRRVAVARRAAAARGRQGPARPAEGAPPRRADDGARAGGRRAAPRARASSRAGRASASSTSATGCRRCSASPTGSRCFATASARGRSKPPACRRRASSR